MSSHFVVHAGLHSWLADDWVAEVVGEAYSGAEALAVIAASRPDVAIIDTSLVDMDVLELCREVFHLDGWLHLLLLGSNLDAHTINAGIDLGVAGFVGGRHSPATLQAAVRSALAGDTYVDPALLSCAALDPGAAVSTRSRTSGVATIAHELATPLTAISGFADTLQRQWACLDDRDKLEIVAIIDEQSRRLGRLVDGVLCGSRSRAQVAHQQRREAVSLGGVIQSCVKTLPGIEVQARGMDDIHVRADADQLAQVVINLMTNADRHGEPPVEISAHAGDRHVEVSVCDAGSGIPAELLPRMFEQFSAGSAPSNAGRPSTGLGLSVVRALIEGMGGDVWYEPAGSTRRWRFVVRLLRA